ncbi:MAG: hypothetical protein WBH00_13240 [Xanthobacteraceae bacterium]
MSWVVVTRPTDPVPSLAEVKAHLRVDHDDNDLDITSKIWGAITEFEDPELGWLGTSVLPRQITLTLAEFSSVIRLPVGPILKDADTYSLVVKYNDIDGVEQAAPESLYQVLDPATSGRRIALRAGQSWPAIGAGGEVRITYWAGYGPADTRISNFKSAVKLHVEMTYDGQTESSHNLPETIRRLLQSYRSMFV